MGFKIYGSTKIVKNKVRRLIRLENFMLNL